MTVKLWKNHVLRATPATSEIKKSTRNRKNKILAAPAAAAASPVKPKTAATRATIKNMRAQLSMIIFLPLFSVHPACQLAKETSEEKIFRLVNVALPAGF